MTRVIACISFGLGNQLLQFAAGYALARRLHCPLDLDVSWFGAAPSNTAPRKFLLTDILPAQSYRRLLKRRRRRDLFRNRALWLMSGANIAYRHGAPIWSGGGRSVAPIETLTAPVCISGVPTYHEAMHYAQDEILGLIADGLARRTQVTPPESTYAFVHVRLGDFVSSPTVAAKMVQLSQAYYAKAMRLYEERHGRTRWILLSDDPPNAVRRLPDDFAIEEWIGKSEMDDLFLMSRSQGGVLANSTFSVWGGLLAGGNEGDIIAPRVWRCDGRAPPKLPEHWIAIS